MRCKDGSFNQSAAHICPNAILIHTDIKNQCKTVEGSNVIYLVIFNKEIITIIIQVSIANNGSNPVQFCNEKTSNIEVKAQAIPNTLCLLDAKKDANIPHHILVKSPCNGDAPLATAIDIDKGMVIRATVSPLFQFCLI